MRLDTQAAGSIARRRPPPAVVTLAAWLFALALFPAPAPARAASAGRCGSAPPGRPAASRDQPIRIEISADGMRLTPLAAGRAEWDLNLVFAGCSGISPWPASVLPPAAAGGRIDLLRGPLTETLADGPKGFEHTLTVPATEEQGPFACEFTSGGTLTPKVADDGRRIDFIDGSGGAVVAWRELRVTDADGRDTDARWERVETGGPGAGLLRLTIEAAGHSGPLRVMSLLAGSRGAALMPQAAPSNDLCAGAEVIPGTGPFPYLSAVHDLTDATTVDDPPAPSCQPNVSRSLWFRFAPATGGSYDFSLCADAPTATTADDTVLGIYEATGDCAGFNEILNGCDDDSCAAGDLQSVLSGVDLAAGHLYYVVAWQYGTAAPPPGLGDVQLRVAYNPPPGPAPANDRCAGAEVIPGSGPFPYLTGVTADISGAGTAGDPPAPSCQSSVSRSIWYTFTPARSGRYTVSTCADAPTATTVDDTVMAIYSGGCAAPAQVSGACDDDSCLAEAAQSVIRGVSLTAGVTYAIVVWQFGLAAPTAGNTAVQLRVTEELPPSNDRCSSATPLLLDEAAAGTTVNAANDTQLPSGSTCFGGLGQTASIAAGSDAVWIFTAPRDGRYSFRVTGFEATKNAVVYVASDCPAGPSPTAIASCLGAANRNAAYPGEEVYGLPLAAGQAVYVYVDENAASTGSGFTIEATESVPESEPNDAPAPAAAPACGLEGSIAPAGDADFFALGSPASGSRLFAMVDGVSANSTDFDLRVVTAADTLEYDDLDNDTPFGSVSPNIAGTPLPGGPAWLRVSHYSAVAQAEPYRLYAAVQPPAAAVPEVEPNDTPASAGGAPALYFAGTLTGSGDIDLFSFPVAAGERVILGLDLDPGRDSTPWNAALALLNASGTVLLSVNDMDASSSTASGAGSLVAPSPRSPAEAIAWRAPGDGTYYARVSWSSGTPGDYLLSITRDCRIGTPVDADGDGVPDAGDCAPNDRTAWAVPGEATGLAVAADRTLFSWSAPAAPGGSAVVYDLLRSASAGDFSAAACVATGITGTSASDPLPPAAVSYYLVRARNACGGNLGSRSDGTPRTAPPCP